MSNLANQQFSSKKISSWTLGTASTLLACLGIFITLIFWHIISFMGELWFKLWFILIILYYIGLFLVAIFGLIKGIKELKSLSRKRLAIVGIILCVIALIVVIISGFYNLALLISSI